MDVGGEEVVDLGVEADVVADVDQEGVLGAYAAGKLDGIIHQLVGVMGFGEAEGIDHEPFGIFQKGVFGFLDGLHVGNVGQFADAITQDGEFAVQHFDGQNVQIPDLQGLMSVYLLELDGGYARVSVLRKTVGQHLQHPFLSYRVGIDVDLTKLTIRSDIIHATYMVVMAVGYQDTVDPAKGVGKDLLTEIRTAVDEQARLFRLYQHGTASPFVLRIGALAYLTLAADDRHATRCPGS